MAEEPQRMKVGDDLYIVQIQGSALREQELNAQQMDPTKFERLVENIRIRGALESIPYAHQPGGEGPITLVSGHHRAKAARMAGLTTIPVMVDYRPMPRSLIRAKQIAHNELIGSPDTEILRRMIEEIDSVDDLLISGLDEEYLPEVEGITPTLGLPHAEFNWRMVTLMFLPEQIERMEDLVRMVGGSPDLVGVAHANQFERFSRAMIEYGQRVGVKSMAMTVDMLTQIALSEMSRIDSEKESKTDGDE